MANLFQFNEKCPTLLNDFLQLRQNFKTINDVSSSCLVGCETAFQLIKTFKWFKLSLIDEPIGEQAHSLLKDCLITRAIWLVERRMRISCLAIISRQKRPN